MRFVHSFIAFTYVHSYTSVTLDCSTGTVTVHQPRNNQLYVHVNSAFSVQASVSMSAEQSEFMSAFEAVTPPPGTSDLTAKVSESLSARTMSALVHKTRVEVSQLMSAPVSAPDETHVNAITESLCMFLIKVTFMNIAILKTFCIG